MVESLQILIADENPEFVLLLKDLFSTIPGIHVQGVARSDQMLIAKIKSASPDVIFLDITPGMGGLKMVDEIKFLQPQLNIIITYHPGHQDSDVLVEALEKGAYECMEKPNDRASRRYSEFRLHLLTITGLLTSRKRFSDTPKLKYRNKFFMPPQPEEVKEGKTKKEKTKYDKNRKNTKAVNISRKPIITGKADVVVIASSTGGPEILSQIFSILPGDLSAPILLVQHIPETMTQYFAKSLDEKSELKIIEAKQNDIIQPSHVYVAPGGQHMAISRPDSVGKRIIKLNSSPPINSVRPSADILFESIAKSYDSNVLAVILTGMGEDGRSGVAQMKKKRCICITQSAETCVVYGMPRAVEENGLSDESMDPLSITQKIVSMAQ